MAIAPAQSCVYQALEPQSSAFRWRRPAPSLSHPRIRNIVKAHHHSEQATDRIKRRQAILCIGTVLTLQQHGAALAEPRKVPQGFKAFVDKNDGYRFFYPFGWEEVVVKGQDIVYKDVIEPLESVSVNIVKTEKENIHDFGPPEKLSKTLIEKFLTAPSQTAELVEVKERETDGKPYYTFEFLAKDKTYTRHALGAVTVANGKFYALVTGANERRWNKIQDRLHGVVDSFQLLQY